MKKNQSIFLQPDLAIRRDFPFAQEGVTDQTCLRHGQEKPDLRSVTLGRHHHDIPRRSAVSSRVELIGIYGKINGGTEPGLRQKMSVCVPEIQRFPQILPVFGNPR